MPILNKSSAIDGYKTNVKFDFAAYEVKTTAGVSLDEAIKSCKFSYVDPEVNEGNYKDNILKSSVLLVWLVSFEYKISTTRVLEKMEWMNLRPATILEMLALVASPSSKNIDYANIVALGTMCRLGNTNYIPFVHIYQLRKPNSTLGTYCKRGGGWTTDYLFAAVAK